jgi:hypothetical protein
MEYTHVIKNTFETEVSDHTNPRTGQQYFNIILTTVATTNIDQRTHSISLAVLCRVRGRQQNSKCIARTDI